MTEDKILDDLYRAAIRLRDIETPFCPICKRDYNSFRYPEIAHFRKRRYRNTRWDVDNAVLACALCNHEDDDHKMEAVMLSRGVDIEAMRKKSLSYDKVDTDEVRDELVSFIRSHYKKKNEYCIPQSVQSLVNVHDS